MPRGMRIPTLWEAVREAESDPRYSEELAHHLLERIRSMDPSLNSFIALNEAAPEQARSLAGVGPLHGVPVAVKDSISTRGLETTAGSRILRGYVPPYDATAVARLRSAGAVVLGKTNMDEFSMGSTGENSAFGPTRNPWDASRVPGGSSSGSAAAVAAGLAPAALGADTGGSVRCPASFTGTFGLRPSYGRVSRYGLIAYASSMDQIGPIARSTRDLAIILSIVAGRDPMDSTSSPAPLQDYMGALERDVSGWKVAVVKEMVGPGVDDHVQREFWRAVDTISGLSVDVEEVSLRWLDEALASYYVIASAEASSNLARYDGLRYGLSPQQSGDWRSYFAKVRGEGFGREVKIRIMLGTYVLSAGFYEELYLKALKVRRLVTDELSLALKRYSLLLSPTMPVLPPRLGERTADPLSMYMMDVETVPASLAGLPAISVPVGRAAGLPVGIQLVGRSMDEGSLLAMSARLEEALGGPAPIASPRCSSPPSKYQVILASLHLSTGDKRSPSPTGIP
ncbi:MAG: Asp-tRNA(Asn)/Glu-tRNA(Gln) amidotransferase subunit GatA [Nitrososphaeria archaeon]